MFKLNYEKIILDYGTLSALAKAFNISRATLHYRINVSSSKKPRFNSEEHRIAFNAMIEQGYIVLDQVFDP